MEQEQKKTIKNKNNYIIIGVAVILIIILCVFLVTDTSKSPENKKSEGNNTATGTNTNVGTNKDKTKVNQKDLEKNIKTSGAVTKYGTLIVFVNNKNTVAVDMEIEVEFYDSEGNLVGSDEDWLNGVGAKSEVAIDMWDTPDNWETYKIYVDIEPTTEYVSFIKTLTIKHNNTGEKITVQITNDNDKEIEEIQVAVVFYENNQVVGYESDVEYDVKSGRSANFDLDYPYDSEYDDVYFDTYKVFINSATTYIG